MGCNNPCFDTNDESHEERIENQGVQLRGLRTPRRNLMKRELKSTYVCSLSQWYVCQNLMKRELKTIVWGVRPRALAESHEERIEKVLVAPAPHYRPPLHESHEERIERLFKLVNPSEKKLESHEERIERPNSRAGLLRRSRLGIS